MFATTVPVEKTFEIWPGRLTFSAGGSGARDALDAAMDAARDLSRSVVADAELLARGAMNVLPRGKAGRLAIETASLFRDIYSCELPPLLAALPGAVCDTVLETMLEAARNSGGSEFVAVSLGDAVAFYQEPGVRLSGDVDMPPVLVEFLVALGEGVQGGAALGGVRSGTPTQGGLDLVAVQSRSAAVAGFAAAILADAGAGVPLPPGAAPKDRLLASAWEGRPVAAGAGLIDADAVWQVLSAAVRQATVLRDKRLLGAASLGVKGRGRTIGPVDGDRLLRFGVSEWR
ncbi:MAG: hypothetical protein RLO08_14170 [Parvibaculaceae bacterium]